MIVTFLFAIFLYYVEAENWEITGGISCSARMPGSNPKWWSPLVGATVELWEHDSKLPFVCSIKQIQALDPNDLLGRTTTDKNGGFRVNGTENEVTKTEPFLLIKHKCVNPRKPLKNVI